LLEAEIMKTLRDAALAALEALESGLSFPSNGRVLTDLRQAIKEHDAMMLKHAEAAPSINESVSPTSAYPLIL
jgi:hypothetical protein